MHFNMMARGLVRTGLLGLLVLEAGSSAQPATTAAPPVPVATAPATASAGAVAPVEAVPAAGAEPVATPAIAPSSTVRMAAAPVVTTLAVAAQAATAGAIPPKIPSAAFAELPTMQGFKIAPDGLHLLLRQDVGGEARVAVIDLTGKTAPKVLGLPKKRELVSYRWAGNNRVLISLGQSVQWFGDEAYGTQLISYDVVTGATQYIGRKSQGLEGDDVLYVDPSGDWILLSIQKSIYDYPSVFRFDLATGEGKEVSGQRTDIYEWYADDAGVVRMGIGWSSGKYRVVYRRSESENFRMIAKPKIDDEDAVFDMIRIYRDTDEGYVLSNEETGRYALHKFNLATRELGEKVFEHPTNDIDDFETTDGGQKLLYASYTDDRERVHYFDETFADLQGLIDGGLKGRQNWMTSWSKSKNLIMVWSGDSNDPGRYYLFQPSAGKMTRYFVPHEQLKPADLARTRYVSYKARDGLEIPAYLTLPRGRPAKNLPLIVMPHGGPFGVRDELSFNNEVQFLVNRGYAVLQPNYRGSTGYGRDFSDKGYGQWGRAMQDDLDDGVDWLAKEAIIDPKRVCLVGASYGGYAALWGAIRNPERYRCAASMAGVADLKKQLAYQLDFFIAKKYQKDWREKVRGAETFDMASVSPVQQAARLQVPVLIVHGEDDATVPYKQSTALVDALKKAGKAYEFYSYPGEGHSFAKPENEKDWLDKLEAFLAKHNPA